MANNPFDRAVINPRERPVSTDINAAQSLLDRTLRHTLEQLFIPRVSIADERPAALPISGFFGNGGKVREKSPVAMEVLLSAGVGFQADAGDVPTAIGGIPSVDDLSRYKPLLLLSDVTITGIPNGDPVNPRIDIVELDFNRRLTDPTSRDVLNTTTGVFDPTTVNKTLAWDLSVADVGIVATPTNNTTPIGYKTGQPSATPATPPTSPGYVKIAEIAVGATVTVLNQVDIKDLRQLLAQYNQRHVAVEAEINIGGGPLVSLNKLVAPPGVLVAANIGAGTRNIYVAAGDVTGLSPVAVASKTAAGTFGVTTQVVNIDSTIQTSLQNAAETDPLLNLVDDSIISLGQPVLEVTISNDGTYHVQIWW